jgi:serine/threonine protein kinase
MEAGGSLPSRKDYWQTHTVLGLLGSGAFGNVYAVRDQEGNLSALKQYKHALSLNTKKEIDILKRLQASGIEKRCGLVGFKGAWLIPQYKQGTALLSQKSKAQTGRLVPSVEMELVQGSDLFDVLAPAINRGQPVDTDYVRKILHDVLEQLDCLHRSGIVHRDIKLENVLASPQAGLQFRLIDYGTVCGKTDDPLEACSRKDPGGTQQYLPPELWIALEYGKSAEQDEAGDIWALGILAWQMRNNEGVENPDGSSLASSEDVAAFLLRAQAQSRGEPIDDLILSMLDPNPSTRPTAAELLRLLDANPPKPLLSPLDV